MTQTTTKPKRRGGLALLIRIIAIIMIVCIGWEIYASFFKPTYVFYNLELQDNETAADDWDFGFNLQDRFLDRQLTAKEHDAEFQRRIHRRPTLQDTTIGDPAFAMANMSYFDVVIGTRFCGRFVNYDSDLSSADWATIINDGIAYYVNHPGAYEKDAGAFLDFLNSDSVRAELTNGEKVTDQMFMNPYTASGIPDVIVRKTNQSGLMLTYVVTIKGNERRVSFRTECGYQPTNVEKIMGIRPVNPTPHPKPTDPPAKPTPTPVVPDKPTPTPTTPPTPTPKPTKDPTQGVQDPGLVGENDDPGPGPDTNSGNRRESSEQTEDGSIRQPSYEDYRREMDNLDQANNQRDQGSNQPSTTPKPGTSVDNSHAGNANSPATVVPPSSQIANDPAGEFWGGPPD